MASYSVAHEKDNLSALIGKVQAGEEVVITNRGRPVARLTPEQGARPDLSAATRNLREQIKRMPPLDIPIDGFRDWLYDDREP